MNLKSRKFLVKLFICILVVWIISSYAYAKITSDVPIRKPTVTIKYNGKVVPTSIGEHTWSGSLPKGQKAGSSYLVGPSYDAGIAISGFSAKTNSEVEVTFKLAPPEIILRSWVVGDSENDTTIRFDSSKTVNNIILPEKKGEYIYEVNGYWSEVNYTSTIFKVIVE